MPEQNQNLFNILKALGVCAVIAGIAFGIYFLLGGDERFADTAFGIPGILGLSAVVGAFAFFYFKSR